MYRSDLITAEAIRAQFEDLPDGFPNDQQVAAISKAMDWYQGWMTRKHRRQMFFLAGFAGTGKTTVAKVIAALTATMDWTVFIAPTGKAASRLRQKGCPTAMTLHKFVYNVRGEDEETGEPIFVAKGALDDLPRLVIMDEASMVGEYDTQRVMDHKIPLLALGDTGQVDPVKAAPYFTDERADVILDQIERNAGNIVRGSMFVRQGKRLPCREFDDVRVTDASPTDDDLLSFAGEDGVILCSYNNTRARINNRIRRKMGFINREPGIGEKLLCTANQHGYNIMNGEQCVITGFKPIPAGSEDEDEDPGMKLVEFRSLTDGKMRVAKFNPDCFDSDSTVANEARKTVGGWDYGYCLTIHKSQGSEWPRVMIMEELLNGCPYAKLMYTAITRAITFLDIRRY